MKTPLYIALIVDENTEQEINSLLPIKKDFDDEFHTTLIYSRKPVEIDESVLYKDIELDFDELIVGTIKDYTIFESESYGKSFVLVLDCEECEELHDFLMKDLNASFDYEKYIPHITLYYNISEEIDQEELFQKFEGMPVLFDRLRVEPFDDKKYQEDRE